MKTFERWAILKPDGKLMNQTCAFTEPGAWDALNDWMHGVRTMSPGEVALLKSDGYRAVRVTVTVEGDA